MKKINKKIRTEHTIMDEFMAFINEVADSEVVIRIIPGRITRKQSGSSEIYINLAYPTESGLKYNLKKGSTSQELFVICKLADRNILSEYISDIAKKYTSK